MKEIIYNAETGEITERPYTAQEIAATEKLNEEIQLRFAAIEKKQNEKTAILEKLGLTEEEIQVFLS
jgi:hypothetical protein